MNETCKKLLLMSLALRQWVETCVGGGWDNNQFPSCSFIVITVITVP